MKNKFLFRVGDRVKIGDTDSFGNVVERFNIRGPKANRYLIELDFAYSCPVRLARVSEITLAESWLQKIVE